MFAISKSVLQKASLSGKVIGELKGSEQLTSGYGYSENIDEENIATDRSFMRDAYIVNSWIRAIVDMTLERFDQVDIFPIPLVTQFDEKSSDYPDAIKKKMENVFNLLMKPNSDMESFSELKKKVVKDVLIFDEGAIQIVRGTTAANTKIPYELYCNVSGEELYVVPTKNNVLKDTGTYVQLRNRKVVAKWDKYDLINFIRNRCAGYANGLSPISSVAASIMGDLESLNYNITFFQNNATPNIAFLFNNLGFGPGQGALKRAKDWYKSEHQSKPHLPLFMGTNKGEVKLQPLTVSNRDMEFSKLELMLLSRIMSVFGMQPMVLGLLTDTTGKLNSEVQTEQFKRNTIIPLVKMFTNMVNSVLIWGDDNLNYDDIYLTSSNLDIDDEQKQSQIWEIFLRTGVITINQVRNELQMPPVDWGDEPFVPLNYAPLSILREWQQSRIDANLRNAERKGEDNQLKVEDKSAGKKKPSAKKDMQNDFLMSNFNFPTGLDQIDSDRVMKAATRLIKMRESRTVYFPMSGTSHKIVKEFGLKWTNIMKKR